MEDFWSEIRNVKKPVVLYGTGDAADRLIALLEERGVKVQGVFVNDGFVRSRSFHGFKVLSYEMAKRIFGDMVIVLGFGSHKREVIETIRKVASENEFYAPDLLTDEDGAVFDAAYAEKHKEDLAFARGLLSDDWSRKVFDNTIRYRLSASIEPLLASDSSDEENWKLLNLRDDEVFLDLGAYNGDTIRRFLSLVRNYDRILGVEPDARSYRKLVENEGNLERCMLFNVGIGDKVEQNVFQSGAGRGSHQGEGTAMPFSTIDALMEGKKATFLKFDIEGQEPKALEGGRNTIGTYKPKMVLSAYHRIDDLWVLPRIVLSIRNDYEFLLRKSPCLPAWDIAYYLK